MHLDPFMKHLGFEGGVTGPGQARLTAVLKHEYLNNWGSAHGGFLFALADSAFALAANSYGDSHDPWRSPSAPTSNTCNPARRETSWKPPPGKSA